MSEFIQPKVGMAVMFVTDIDGDGWPEIRTGEISEVTQDVVTVKNGQGEWPLNPDHNTQVSGGALTTGRWKYV